MRGIIEEYIFESKKLDPSSLTKKEFWSIIDRKKGDKYIKSEVVDWGSVHRGQGKRIGKMVVGAMSSAQRGKKSYHDILGSAPLSNSEKEEASSLDNEQQVMLAKALEAGFSSNVAFLVAYSVGKDKIDRNEVYKLAQDSD